MKFNNISFPHPVLGVSNSINSDVGFKKIEHYPVDNRYFFEFEMEQNNADLSTLLNDGKAEYYCELICTNTLLRNVYTSSVSRIQFELPRKQVKGKVKLIFLLVSKYAIKDYDNADKNSDYNGFTFNIDSGDVLAYLGKYEFEADIKYEKLQAVSEILVVIENPSLEFPNIVLDKKKIEVQLPSESYKKFSGQHSKVPGYKPVFFASIALNPLLIALYNFENHKDQFWAKAINYRLTNEEQFRNLSIEETANIPEVAQRLLGNPFKTLMFGLDDLEEINEIDD